MFSTVLNLQKKEERKEGLRNKWEEDLKKRERGREGEWSGE